MKKINKKLALEIYRDIQIARGEHCGRWEGDEYGQKDSSEIYFEEMINISNYLELNYSNDPNSYIDNDEDVIYPEDTAGFILYNKLENILTKIILEE